MIRNVSDRSIFITARGAAENSENYKNIYINKPMKGTRNQGSFDYELRGNNSQTLWLIGDRYGWQNMNFIS